MMEVKTRFEGNDDPFLVDKIAGRVKGFIDERPAIFNKLKAAWERLSERDFMFDIPAVVKQTTDNWITSGDNVSAFLKDASEIQGENEITINDEWQWIPTNTVYEMYCIWAERSGVGKLSKNNLTSRIKSIGHASDVKKLNGKAHRCVYLNLLIDKNREMY
jgi:phage/plasmid-associated DNA primase